MDKQRLIDQYHALKNNGDYRLTQKWFYEHLTTEERYFIWHYQRSMVNEKEIEEAREAFVRAIVEAHNGNN